MENTQTLPTYYRHVYKSTGTIKPISKYNFCYVEGGDRLLTETIRLDYNQKGAILHLIADSVIIKSQKLYDTAKSDVYYLDIEPCAYNSLKRTFAVLSFSKNSKEVILDVFKGFYPSTYAEQQKLIKVTQQG